MIVRLENQTDRKVERIKLYKDEVFLIAHEEIKARCSSLSVEEVFCTADAFTEHLLINNLSEVDILQYEVDDLSEELADDTDKFLVISLTFVKLCALRKTRPNAVEIARAMVAFCNKYDEFATLLKLLTKKEHARWIENKQVDLMTYDLRTIREVENPKDSKSVVSLLVDSAIGMSVEGIQHIENVLSETNDKLNHYFDNDLQRLREERKKKSTVSFNFDKFNDIHDNGMVSIGNK